MSKPTSSTPDTISMLGPTMVLKGTVTAKEDLLLKGRVEGSIEHTGNLRISQEGSVKGEITAKQITVEGTVDGDMYGIDSVAVQATAKVSGNIYARSIRLIEGARFSGGIDMDDDAVAEKSGPLRVAAVNN